MRACPNQDGFVHCDVVISLQTTRGIWLVRLLQSVEENYQYDDDEKKKGGNQQRPQRRGDVTLVSEPVSASESLNFSGQSDLVDFFREVK